MALDRTVDTSMNTKRSSIHPSLVQHYTGCLQETILSKTLRTFTFSVHCTPGWWDGLDEIFLLFSPPYSFQLKSVSSEFSEINFLLMPFLVRIARSLVSSPLWQTISHIIEGQWDPLWKHFCVGSQGNIFLITSDRVFLLLKSASQLQN